MKKNTLFAKLFAIMLSAAVAVSLTGCGSSSASTTSSESTTSVTESSAEESSEAEAESSEESSEKSSEESSEEASEAANASDEVIEIGEGETDFTFEIVFADETEKYYSVHTDETTVGAALLGVGLIEGEDSEYGLYVKTVDGVTADYDVDQTYWAFYIDGEYASTGVDSTDITAGSTYTFKVES
jgi:hypothetical protein